MSKFILTSQRTAVLQSVSHHLKQQLQQKEQQWRQRCEQLEAQVQHLQEDREELQSRLEGSHAQEGRSLDHHANLKCAWDFWKLDIW